MGREHKHLRAAEPISSDDSVAAEFDDTLGRVVVVDDEPHLSFLLRIVLEKAGYQVIEAANGEVALEHVAEASTQLVVTDRMMPVMNGPTLIARLRANPTTASIPIVMVSSNPDTTVDADAFVNKPFEPDELVRVAERLIEAAKTNRGISS